MAIDHVTEFKEDIQEFHKVTRQFYNGELTVPQYKSFSGGFGSYAQRGGERSMLRLRLAGGEINQDNLSFIVDSIKKYQISLVHLTTCQSVQLHNLTEETVCELIGEAFDHGIITRGGGGDFPRNVMCSPLSGVEQGEYLDVLPYAKEAADYLLGFIKTVKLPRKLKVCFTNSDKDEVHATFRDMGFVATKEHKFDVYIAGGLGIKPKMGVPVVKGLEPDQILYCIKSMVDVFTEHGNYQNRAASRSRFMQDTLGVEGLQKAFQEKLEKNLEAGGLTINIQADKIEKNTQSIREISETCLVENNRDVVVANEKNTRLVPQKQTGLYAVAYHPVGGSPKPEFFGKLQQVIGDMKEVKIRITPDQGLYVINLTAEEAQKVLEVTKDGADTLFETSSACIGASICQVGIGDSQEMLKKCVERVRKEHFPDRVLPKIYISGCPSSCTGQQIGAIGFRGGKKPTPEGPKFSFAVYENGCEYLGSERFGTDVGNMLVEDIPEFLVDLGKEVMSHGMIYDEYVKTYPDGLKQVAAKYL